ncbi:MAG: tetratricopeptide repeat protein [Candidatus Sulfotelmatobacter sp.]
MSYDLFVSYSRRDNEQGRVTELVERIRADFGAFAGRPLQPFFDVTDIHGMEDWRHRILQGLRESRLLLACLSPSFLESEYCEWEFNEYLKHEIGQEYFGDGIAPIYFVDVPGWSDRDFEQRCATWVTELRRRQNFDFRPWFYAGEEALRDATVQDRMRQLNLGLKERISRGERAERSLGNVDAHNPHFIGRTIELRRLRETVALGKVGVLTAIHGMGGVGKTALAVEYAHAFAHEYGGGRWQVRCEGKENLCATLAELAAPLRIEFNEIEKKDTDRQFQRVLAELHRLADSHEPHRCLVLLDNVDKARLLEPVQAKRLPAEDWLHVLATTQLGETDLCGAHKDRAFLPVDEMPESDALELIESYQLKGRFDGEVEREAALEIVRLLGGFTLAVEAAAVYLGQFAGDVSCAAFLERLKKEGLRGLDTAALQTREGLLHGEKRLAATLGPTLERLAEPEKLALSYAALLPADHIALTWIRALLAEKSCEMGKDAEPGYPDPWMNLLRRLLSLRLLQVTKTTDRDLKQSPRLVRMHRLLQELLQGEKCPWPVLVLDLSRQLAVRASESDAGALTGFPQWELECLRHSAEHWLSHGSPAAQMVALKCSSALSQVGCYVPALSLGIATLRAIQTGSGGPSVSEVSCRNVVASVCLSLGDYAAAEKHLAAARALTKDTTDEAGLDVITNLGCLYRETCRPQEALPLAEEALHLSETISGPNGLATALRCVNLGLVYQDLCRLADAVSLFRRAVHIDHTLLGEEHITSCQDVSTLAEALRNAGETAEAEALLRRALSIAANWDTPIHPARASLLTNLARILEDRGEVANARRMIEEALDVNKVCHGEGSPRLAPCVNNLGVNSLMAHEYRQAILEFEKAAALEQSPIAANACRLAHRQLNLAIAYLLNGQHEQSRHNLELAWVHARTIRDVLTGRVLLVRLALAFVADEPSELYLGQLITLMTNHCLYAPCFNIKWALTGPIRHALRYTSVDAQEIWTALCEQMEQGLGKQTVGVPEFCLRYAPQPIDVTWPRASS